jgi:hypothetical protein
MDDIEARLIGALPLPFITEERIIERGGKSSVSSSSPLTLATVDAAELRVRRMAVEE